MPDLAADTDQAWVHVIAWAIVLLFMAVSIGALAVIATSLVRGEPPRR